MSTRDQDTFTMPPSPGEDEPTVIDALGVEITVSNPAVAAALRAQTEQCASPSQRSGDPADVRRLRAEVAEAVPEVLIAPVTPKDAAEALVRTELRRETEILATILGYTVLPEGAWRSPQDEQIVVRVVTGLLTAAGAADMLAKLEGTFVGGVGVREALIVTQTREQADTMVGAILARASRCCFRVSTIDTLARLGGLVSDGRLDPVAARRAVLPSAQLDLAAVLGVLGD